MIKILIVDDDQYKIDRIIAALRTVPELNCTPIVAANDLVTARDLLAREGFDLLILDICLPVGPKQQAAASAGKQFVRELSLSATLIKPAHIIGITAYDDAIAEADDAFIDEVWRIIRFDRTGTAWETQLLAKVSYLLRVKREAMSGENSGYSFDLAIVTALRTPELQAVLDLPLTWQSMRFSNDPTEYHVGASQSSGKLQVVAASSAQMGMAASSVLSMKMIHHFRPRYLCIVGIAAGIKAAGISLGDILIAEQSWDYESGKRRQVGKKSELIPDPRTIPLRSDLKELLSSCIGRGAYLNDIQSSWRGPQSTDRLKAVLGPVATGAAVIEDPIVAEKIREHARKLIGIEMETYGVFYAAENCSKPRPSVFSIKSACDFADADKDNDWQNYAAFTSAQYLWRFATENLAI